METQSRVGKSIKNTGFGLVGMAISLIVQFVSRTFFIRLLGTEYNGINGLFSNILQVLNLAELGFAYSVAYALYAPLQSENKEKISAIMNFLRRVYNVITLIVLVAGVACIPFLQYLIKEDISTLPFTINEIRGFFAVYLLNTAFSYVFSYKRTIITADQKSYLVSNVDNFGNVALYAIQIVVLFVWRNYYVYLALMSAKTLLGNLLITIIANRKYPYLKQNRKLKLSKDERTAILKNVGAMFFHKIGGVIVYSNTTIIISAFVGIIDASKYVNYILVINAVRTVIDLMFSAITASVGNLCTSATEDYQYRVFRRVSYVSNFFSVFSFVCFLGLFNPFISLWVGENMTFDLPVVLALSFSAMVSTSRSAVNTFKTAKGLFTKDWYKPLLEAGLGVALAIILSFHLGTLGVVLGYTLPALFIAIPIETIVLYKYGFGNTNAKVVMQFLRLLGSIVLSALAGGLAYYITTLLGGGIVWFIIKLLICAGIGALAFIACTFYLDAFKYYCNLAKKFIGKLFRRKKIEDSAKSVDQPQQSEQTKSVDQPQE
ncbi:MAG: hypothetical protein IJY70_05830 [Clostridia bacterium]|nr:hypothetical protein [Clostridia bacterium]